MDDIIVGSYGEHGDPCIKFFLRGTVHDHPGIQYEGLVDTGFTGFVQVNFREAFRLRLALEGLTSVRLADGSSNAVLTAIGHASLTDEPDAVSISGTVHLSRSTEILIGMEFLRSFDKGLGVFKNSVILIPDEPSSGSD